MAPTIIESAGIALRRRGRVMLTVAILAIAPFLALTELVEVLAAGDGAIINGRLVPGADVWTTLTVSATVDGAQVRVALPMLVATGWLLAMVVCLRALAGDPPGTAWRRGGALSLRWLVLGVLAIVATVAAVVAATWLGANLGLVAAVVALVVLAYGLLRLAPALPALVIDGHGPLAALRRAVAVTRGRTLATSTVLLVNGIGVPLAFAWLADDLADFLASIDPSGGTPILPVVGSFLHHVVLVGMVPAQAALLFAVYRAGTAEPVSTRCRRRRAADPPCSSPQDWLC